MRNEGHDDSIKKGTFLMVCSGETYSAEIINGTEIMEKLFEAVFGEASLGNHDERELYRDEIDDPDYWNHDQDFGPTSWSSDIGETDHINLFRITDTARVVKALNG